MLWRAGGSRVVRHGPSRRPFNLEQAKGVARKSTSDTMSEVAEERSEGEPAG